MNQTLSHTVLTTWTGEYMKSFWRGRKGVTVINSLGGIFTLGTSLILCYRSPWGITYIPHARDILSIRLLLIVCVMLVDITEPKQKQHIQQNPYTYNHLLFSAKSCLTLCNPMDYSTPGFPVLHYLLELAQIHVH